MPWSWFNIGWQHWGDFSFLQTNIVLSSYFPCPPLTATEKFQSLRVFRHVRVPWSNLRPILHVRPNFHWGFFQGPSHVLFLLRLADILRALGILILPRILEPISTWLSRIQKADGTRTLKLGWFCWSRGSPGYFCVGIRCLIVTYKAAGKKEHISHSLGTIDGTYIWIFIV